MTITCVNHAIKLFKKIKVLGIYVTETLDNSRNINSIIQKVNYRMNLIKRITKYTNIKTRKILYESNVISVFTYCIENFMGTDSRNINELQVLLNNIAHRVIGFRSYKMSTHNILKEL